MSPWHYWSFSLSLLLSVGYGGGAPSQTPKLDQYGDPLPQGALLRIGTVRLRTGARIESLAFSADGKRMVTATRLTGMRVWEVASGRELRSFTDAGEHVRGLAVSPDGCRVAFVNDVTCTVRDTATGAKVREFAKPWDGFRQMHFSRDGQRLVVHFVNREASIWDVATGQLVRTLSRPDQETLFEESAFSPDGKTLALVARPGFIQLWDLDTGKVIREFGERHKSGHDTVVFAPDGKRLAALWGGGRQVEIWDTATGKGIFRFDTQTSCRGLVFSGDGQTLFSIDDRSSITGRDAGTGKVVAKLPDIGTTIRHFAMSPDSKRVATAGDGPLLRLWDVATGKELIAFDGHNGPSRVVRFGRDGKTLISTTAWNTIALEAAPVCFWDIATGKLLRQFPAKWADERFLSLSDDGRLKAVATRQSFEADEIELVDTKANTRKAIALKPPFRLVEGLELTPDGKHLMVNLVNHQADNQAGYQGTVQLWEVETGKVCFEVTAKPGGKCWSSFGEDGRALSVFSGPGGERRLDVFDLKSGRHQKRFGLALPARWDSRLSPSGRLAAVIEYPLESVVLVEVATRKQVARWVAKSHQLTCLCFSPDGRLAATGTDKGPILVWDVFRGQVVAELKGHERAVNSVCFAPDGRRLVSGSEDTTILVWDAKPWLAGATGPGIQRTARELEKLWMNLASPDGTSGFAAQGQLLQSSKETVAWLREKLKMCAAEFAKIPAWIKDLDCDSSPARAKAMAELQMLGEAAAPLLYTLLDGKPSLELRGRAEALLDKLATLPASGITLQTLRALEVLEMMHTPQAQALLEALAQDDAGAWLTEEAKAGWQRSAKGP
jgi:WD40 repeat protein